MKEVKQRVDAGNVNNKKYIMPNQKEDKIKIPKKTLKKMPVYSKVSGLDITKKGNQERTNDYTVSSSRTDKFYEEAERMGVTKKPNFSNLAAGGSAFKMKGFSGFKSESPVKKDFNMIGDKASTTPGYSRTKIAKAKKTKSIKKYLTSSSDKATNLGPKNTIKSEIKRGIKSFSEAAKGKMKNMKVPSGSSRIVKGLSTAGKVARVASRASGAGLIAELGYAAYKSGQKHSGGKAVKGQKTNALNMRKSIFKK